MDGMTAPSERTRVHRMGKRGAYDAATVHAILDAALMCHVGYVVEGQPYVTPTAHWRDGGYVYWHGSSASRMLRTLEGGVDVCVTASLLDGLVLARSGFHHSMNYRAVMALGRAELVGGKDAKPHALKAFSDRLVPGRWETLRPPVDDEEDYALPVWAGVLPLSVVAGEPVADPRVAPGTPVPDNIGRFKPEPA